MQFFQASVARGRSWALLLLCCLWMARSALVAAADDPREELEHKLMKRVANLQDRQVEQMSKPGLFRKFEPILDALNLPPDQQPDNLFDLSNALTGHPDLLKEFLRL